MPELAPTRKETTNLVLQRLNGVERGILLEAGLEVTLDAYAEVHQPGQPIPYVYFPHSGMISLTVFMEDGKEVEAGTIGREGMVGLYVALGLDMSPIRAIAQIPGHGLRVPTTAFLKALNTEGNLKRLTLRYVAYFLQCSNQNLGCNLHHQVKERMARWLLMCHDRVGHDEFFLTHEFLGEMLGVRRQSVSEVAGELQAAGLITYHRGTIRILQRSGLEQVSCECYRVIQAAYPRLMS